MRHLVGMSLFLAGLWLLLSGYLIGWLLALGVASIALSVYIVHRMEVIDHEAFPIHLGLGALVYYPWLFKEIIVSNFVVAKAIIVGPKGIQPEMLVVEASQDSEVGYVTYANSITLTPGTITTGLDDNKMTVHALLTSTADGLRTGEMDQRVSRMTNSRQAKS